MPVSYDRQTLDNPNLIARFAHRTRFKKALNAVLFEFQHGGARIIVDYGCGGGRFLSELHKTMESYTRQTPESPQLFGYDPFMASIYEGYEVVGRLEDVPAHVDMITCLEVCEHLDDVETGAFLGFCRSKLRLGGRVLISVPIMIGPALFAKEATRMILHRRKSDTSLRHMLLGGLFNIPPPRATDIKSSHRGYDWRQTAEKMKGCGFLTLERLYFSPLPLIRAYGNSQAFLEFCRTGNQAP